MDLSHVRFEGEPAPASRGPRGSLADVRSGDRTSAPAIGSLPAIVLGMRGLDPAAYRARPLERRIAACLRALRAGSEHAAASQLRQQPDLMDSALSTLLIGVTSFFRDRPVFAALRDLAIPTLAGRSPRVLSLGCSNGAELYSVAILLAETGLLEGAELLGIDCRAEAIRQAAAGTFPLVALEGVDPGLLRRHFEPEGSGSLKARATLRRALSWRVEDGTCGVPAGPWDIVLCRNVLIYLQPPIAAAMVERIARELAPGGFLVVGKAERPAAALPLKAIARCLYRHVG